MTIYVMALGGWVFAAGYIYLIKDRLRKLEGMDEKMFRLGDK